MNEELLSCPFCGETPEISKHFRDPLWQLIHRCHVMGAITIDWRESEQAIAEQWNTRVDQPEIKRLRTALEDCERMLRLSTTLDSIIHSHNEAIKNAQGALSETE